MESGLEDTGSCLIQEPFTTLAIYDFPVVKSKYPEDKKIWASVRALHEKDCNESVFFT